MAENAKGQVPRTTQDRFLGWSPTLSRLRLARLSQGERARWLGKITPSPYFCAESFWLPSYQTFMPGLSRRTITRSPLPTKFLTGVHWWRPAGKLRSCNSTDPVGLLLCVAGSDEFERNSPWNNIDRVSFLAALCSRRLCSLLPVFLITYKRVSVRGRSR